MEASMDNIDDRLERLTRNAETLLALAAKHDGQIAANSKDIAGLGALWSDIAEGIARLVHTAELHDRRLDSHSDRLDNLEGT
jgi:ABC-type transporter Mla subunit MlaD